MLEQILILALTPLSAVVQIAAVVGDPPPKSPKASPKPLPSLEHTLNWLARFYEYTQILAPILILK